MFPKLFHIPVKPKCVCVKIHRKTVPAEWDENLLSVIPVSHGAWFTATWFFLPPTCNPASKCNPPSEHWCGLCLVCASETELEPHQFQLPSWKDFARQTGTKN